MGWLQSTASFLGLTTQQASGGNPADDRYFEPYMPAGATGLRITADSALKCAAVFRCVTIWADVLSTLPFSINRLRQDGLINSGMDPEPNHPVHDIISLAPNPRQTPADFWGMMIFHSMLRGVAYAEIKPGPRGAVHSLEPIHPDRIPPSNVELLPDGTLRFKVMDPKNGSTRILLQEELLRLPGISSDGINGLRTIELASDAVALLMAADQAAARVFSNGLNIGGFLSHPGKLSNDAITRLRQRLMERFAGVKNVGVPAILQEGMKYEKAQMNLQEAQLLEARKAQVRDISNYFGGVPLHLLGIDDGTGRVSTEDQWINFVRSGIRPHVERIQQAIRRDLIIAPRRYVAVIDIDDLERGNMATRGDFWSKALGSGGSPAWLTVNEIRAEEGWNPSDDPHADKLALGTNPQSTPGATGAAPAAAPAALAAPTDVPLLTGPAESIISVEVEAPSPEIDTDRAETLRSIETLGRREVAQLRKLHVRHADDSTNFRKAVTAFYSGFTTQVMSKLDVSKDEARAWCGKRSIRVGGANDIGSMIDAIEDEYEAAVTAPVEGS